MDRRQFMKTSAAFAALSAAGLASGRPAHAMSDAEYNAMIDASKAERGILIYSNSSNANWAPILDAFKQKYPWINAENLDIGGERWERYYAESSSNARTADFMLAADVPDWLEFVAKGQCSDYVPREIEQLPEWATLAPGVFAIAADPMMIIYNKQILQGDDAPKSMADIARLCETKPDLMRNRISTYSAILNGNGYAMAWTWTHGYPDHWKIFDTIGPMTRPERSAGPISEKIATGEYVVGFFIAPTVVFPNLQNAAWNAVVGWNLIHDMQPMQVRGMTVTRAASSPNSANLLLDFILSREGQIAGNKGHFTPYRSDVGPGDVEGLTFSGIAEQLGGEDRILLGAYNPQMVDEREEFLARWRQSFTQAG